MAYSSRVATSWSADCFFSFRWWDAPACAWFALFGPREAGETPWEG